MRPFWHFSAALIVTVGSTAVAQSVPTLRLVPEMRVDGATNNMVSIGRVRVGPKNEVMIPQAKDRNILVMDSTGRRLRTVGRRGQGPGEFTALSSRWIGWVGDSVWVWD